MTSKTSKHVKRPQMISIDPRRHRKVELFKPVLKPESAANRTTNGKKKLKSGSLHETDEINDENFYETLHENNP